MGWYTPAPGLSASVQEAFDDLYNSSSSEAHGVLETLNTIAENGQGMGDDDFLVGCAEEMRDWCQHFIDKVKPKEPARGKKTKRRRKT